jgi:hypothetical protein
MYTYTLYYTIIFLKQIIYTTAALYFDLSFNKNIFYRRKAELNSLGRLLTPIRYHNVSL